MLLMPTLSPPMSSGADSKENRLSRNPLVFSRTVDGNRDLSRQAYFLRETKLHYASLNSDV